MTSRFLSIQILGHRCSPPLPIIPSAPMLSYIRNPSLALRSLLIHVVSKKCPSFTCLSLVPLRVDINRRRGIPMSGVSGQPCLQCPLFSQSKSYPLPHHRGRLVTQARAPTTAPRPSGPVRVHQHSSAEFLKLKHGRDVFLTPGY